MKAAVVPEDMDRELQSFGLLPTWPDTVDEMSKSHAGYLAGIEMRQVQGTRDVLVIQAGIYKGAGCSIDVTAVELVQNAPNPSPGDGV